MKKKKKNHDKTSKVAYVPGEGLDSPQFFLYICDCISSQCDSALSTNLPDKIGVVLTEATYLARQNERYQQRCTQFWSPKEQARPHFTKA